MKKLVCFWLFMFLSLGATTTFFPQFVSIAFAQESLSGEVLSIDPVEKKIVLKYLIKPDGHEYEAELFLVNDKTQITKNKTSFNLNDVKVGDKADINFEKTDNTKILISLNIN
jgi:hypothetical protein